MTAAYNRLDVSERRACCALSQACSTQRREPQGRDDEAALTADIIALAGQYGRYGYRRVTAMLRDAGWLVNPKRVERIWRRVGLKVPLKQPNPSRLWLNDGSCVRLRAEYANHVWSYDFVYDRTSDGRTYLALNMIDEYTRECLAIVVPGNSPFRMFSTPWPTYSSAMACRNIFSTTMAQK